MVNLLMAAVTAISLNGQWSFTHDVSGRSGWRDVEVPHDWAIAGPFDPDGECRTGKLPWKGKGLYRREFVVPDNGWRSADLFFGGAMSWPRVKLNGKDVGGWDYGYASFRLDVTKALKTGTNVVEVTLDTTPMKARFYPGAGLYREVELKLYGKDERLLPDTVFITTPEITAKRAKVVVEYETTSGRGRKEFEVADPRLWDVDDPYLYELELFGEKFRYGIRKAEFTPDDGFHLNGRRVQLKGVNLHSDLGPLGMAFNRSAARRQLEIMKDMGANAVRTSHNFPDRTVLDMCDELGLLVWDEAFDKWDETAARKPEQDVDEFARRNVEALVRRDRNHPSVIVWSIGNEICEVGVRKRGETVSTNLCTDGVSAERCAMLRDAVRALDPTRPVGIGCCFARQVGKGILDCMDLTGWNYGRVYRRMRERRPDKPLVYSETASAVSGFGEYDFKPAAYPVDWNTNRWTVDAFEHCTSPWSDIPEVEFNRMETDRYVAGEFVWTGIDYLGEPTPFNNHGIFPDVPASKLGRSSYFGICDLNVLPKDRYWLYRSYWNPDAFTLEIAPHWNWKGFEGRKLPVFVYTNGDEAELFLNGRSLGRRRKLPVSDYSPVRGKNVNREYGDFRDNPYYAICDRYRLRWLEVPYEPGELRVVAWRGGKRLGEKTMRTAEKPQAVRLGCTRSSLPADGETLAWVEIDVVDAAGTRDPLASHRVSFRIDGPGRIVAVSNGDARSCKSFAETSWHPLYNGKAVAVIRREKGAKGMIRLTASVDGMRDGVMEFPETVSAEAVEYSGRFRRVFKYDVPDRSPIWFGGVSRADKAAAADYCVVADIIYEDGTGAWNKRAYFSGGTHGWEKSSAVFFPAKPVKRIDLQALLRKGTGSAKFRDVFLERSAPAKGTVLHEYRRSDRPFSARDEIVTETFDGERSVYSFASVPERGVPDCPLGKGETAVWTADSMRCVTPLTFPSAADTASPRIRLELAGRERESAQICVSTGPGEGVGELTVEVPLLRAEDDSAFNGDVTWQRVGYVPRPAVFCAHPYGPAPAEKWVPDPLLPAAPFRVRGASTQGVWLTVAADAKALPGTYHGEVRVFAGGKMLAAVPMSVRVRNFALPATFRHRSSFSVMDGFLRRLYPKRYREMRRTAWDMMLDHRLNPDDISRTSPPPVEDLLYARSRGMNLFNVLNLVKPDPDKPWVLCSKPKEIFTEEFDTYLRGVLTPYIAELKRHGLFDMAYLYGFDERGKEYYAGLLERWPKWKKEYGLPLFTTARMYHDLAYGKLETNSPYASMTDWHCPLTQIYRPELTDMLHGKGRQVWWYTCCGPWYPYANMAAFDHPWIEARLLYWMTHMKGMDGFLFWCVNHWGRRCPGVLDESDTYFPTWNAWSVFGTPGDGILMYPGRYHLLPGIRLAGVRDGAEDYEYLALAAEKDPDAVGVEERGLIKSMTEFTRDPEALRAARSRIAAIIEKRKE